LKFINSQSESAICAVFEEANTHNKLESANKAVPENVSFTMGQKGNFPDKEQS